MCLDFVLPMWAGVGEISSDLEKHIRVRITYAFITMSFALADHVHSELSVLATR